MFDYESLRIIWWAFFFILIIGFAISSGFDLGVGILLPFITKIDKQRTAIINQCCSRWEAKLVFFVLLASALFNVWPLAYSLSFTSLYFVWFALLFSLILRPLGYYYRSKLIAQSRHYHLDKLFSIASLVSVFIFGLAFGNVLKGIPFNLENDMQIAYFGSYISILNPFSLLLGLISLSMFLMHGAVYLQLKRLADINRSSRNIALVFTLLTLILFACAGFWINFLSGYHITSEVFPNGLSDPFTTAVKREASLWLDNYGHLPVLWTIPGSVFISGLITMVLIKINKPNIAFIFSTITLVMIILTAACSLFPFIIPSSIAPNSSLTIWNSSASLNTLLVMFWLTIIFLPILVIYACWVFRIFRVLRET